MKILSLSDFCFLVTQNFYLRLNSVSLERNLLVKELASQPCVSVSVRVLYLYIPYTDKFRGRNFGKDGSL